MAKIKSILIMLKKSQEKVTVMGMLEGIALVISISVSVV